MERVACTPLTAGDTAQAPWLFGRPVRLGEPNLGSHARTVIGRTAVVRCLTWNDMLAR